MWNHAPRMWEQLKNSNVSFPQFTPEEMANLFAYLYVTGYDDESGCAGCSARVLERCASDAGRSRAQSDRTWIAEVKEVIVRTFRERYPI